MKSTLFSAFFVALLGLGDAFAVNYVSLVNGGNWNTAATWSPNGIPTAADNVTISAGHTINISTANAFCNNLTFNNSTVNFTAAFTLAISGDITTNGSGLTSAFTGNNVNQIVNLAGNLSVTSGNTHNIGGVTFTMTNNARTATINGTLSFTSATGTKTLANVAVTSTGTLTNSVARTIAIQNLTLTDGATINGTGSLTINAAGSLSVLSGTFGNQVSLGNCILSITGTTTVAGKLSFTSATGTKTFSGTITVAAGGTWDNAAGATCVVNCSITSQGLWTNPTGGVAPYSVTSSGQSYTYTCGPGKSIVMGSLTMNGTSTITNTATLTLASPTTALTAQGGSGFFNYNLVNFSACTTCVSVTASTVNFTFANNTVNYNSTGVTQNVFPTTYVNLAASNSTTAQLTGTTTVNNQVAISGSATLFDNGSTLTGTATLNMTGTSTLQYSKTGVTLPELTGTPNTLGPNTNMTFQGGGAYVLKSDAVYPYQTVNINGGAANFSNVTLIQKDLIFGGGQMTNNPALVVNGLFSYGSIGVTTTLINSLTTGSFDLNGGTLNYSGQTITVNGANGTWNFSNLFGGGFVTDASSTVQFSGGVNQQITSLILGLPFGGVTTFQNLIVTSPGGVTLNGTNANVARNLTLSGGNVITGTNTLIFTASTTTITRISGFVDGNFRKVIATGAPTVTFEVGKSGVYSPVSLAFTGVTISGSVTCSVAVPDHPSVSSSPLNPSKTVNRFWSITNNATTFTSYNATFNFVAGDIDVGSITGNFRVYRYNGTAWSATTAGVRTATSTQFTGEVSANLPNGAQQDFAIGEIIVTTTVFNAILTGNWSSASTWIQLRTGSVTFTSGSSTVTGVGTLFTTELIVGDVLLLQASPTIVRGTVQSITNNTTLVLTANAGATASGAYGRNYVPNSISDVVTIGNSNNAGASTITLDMNASVNTLNLNTVVAGLAGAQTLTHSGTNQLTVLSNVNINQPTAAATDVWNINAGSATVGGATTLGTGLNSATQIARINITTGSLTTVNLVFNTSNNNGNELSTVLNLAGSTGTVNLSGAILFTNNRGLLLGGTSGSNFNFNGTTAQTMVLPTGNQGGNVWSYNNVLFNNAVGVTYSGSANGTTNIAAANLTGDFRLQTGKFIHSGNSSITGNGGTATFFLANGTTMRFIGANGLPTGFTTYTMQPSSTVEYSNSGSLNLLAAPASARSYGNLFFNSPAFLPTFAFGNAAYTANNLTMGDGVSNILPTVQGTTATTLALSGNVNLIGDTFLSGTGFSNISIAGNFVDTRTLLNFTGANVTFNGSGTQTFSAALAGDFANLTINTTGATNKLQLLSDVTVTNTLTLTQGELDLNAHNLTVSRSATNAIVRTGGYIKSETTTSPYGQLIWTIGNQTGSFVFPFGKSSTVYIPLTINITSAGTPGSGTGNMTVSTYGTGLNNTPLPTGVGNLNGSSNGLSVVDRFWTITPDYTNGNPIATVTFVADNTEVATVSPGPPLNAQRWSPAGYWDAALGGTSVQTYTANTPAANTSQLVITNLNPFSSWTLTSTSAPLPVQLTRFDATPTPAYVSLDWETETELNNAYFAVEHSVDGEKFQEINRVDGAGTTSVRTIYSSRDYAAVEGNNYYRLRQVDLDGKPSYSPIRQVMFDKSAGVVLYPNPSTGGTFTVRFGVADSGKDITYQCIDTYGQVVTRASGRLDERGEFCASMKDTLRPGAYVVLVSKDGQLTSLRVIVQ